MPADYSRIHRLLGILTLIQSGGSWNATRLAEEFRVSERTIYRDLDVLETLGIPYCFDESVGGYRVRRDFFLPPIDLTLDESLALVVIGEHVAQREQVPLMGAAFRAIAKIRSRLPADLRSEIDEFEQHIAIDLARSGPHEGIRDVYERVRDAIVGRRVLHCRYESIRSSIEGDEEERPFDFHPYALLFSQRAWYIVGHHAGRGEVRCMKMNRFSAVQATETTYEIPEGFTLRRFLGNAWRLIRGDRPYDVELRFDRHFADTIDETRWHDTQETELHPDGSLTFRCTVDGLDEIKWWVLGMGPHCTVVHPPELARGVRSLAAGIVERYEGDGADEPRLT